MPIRINLLAESQAAEEDRRKDPVKRAAYISAFVVFLVVLWAGTLQMKIMATNSDLKGVAAQWGGLSEGYEKAVELQRRNIDVGQKLSALNELATNRFLWGTALNALQYTLNGVQGVRVLRVATDQTYLVTEDIPPNPATQEKGRQGTSTENISITIEAEDSSDPPGGQVAKFKAKIAQVPFFAGSLRATNGIQLASLSPPQQSEENGRSFVRFTMKCFFPEKVR